MESIGSRSPYPGLQWSDSPVDVTLLLSPCTIFFCTCVHALPNAVLSWRRFLSLHAASNTKPLLTFYWFCRLEQQDRPIENAKEGCRKGEGTQALHSSRPRDRRKTTNTAGKGIAPTQEVETCLPLTVAVTARLPISVLLSLSLFVGAAYHYIYIYIYR